LPFSQQPQPSECIDLFVIDYIFVSFSGNKYDDDDDDVNVIIRDENARRLSVE